jgi:hypothetical protein
MTAAQARTSHTLSTLAVLVERTVWLILATTRLTSPPGATTCTNLQRLSMVITGHLSTLQNLWPTLISFFELIHEKPKTRSKKT